MNSLSRTQKPRAGFTLLEVMVVIVILGVLASLVVPNLLGNKEKADRQKAISDIVALAQISVTGICRSFSKQCLNADSHFWKSCW